ncbi:MAG: SBBP repeat-containing protein [Bacteroidota bacterium]
MKKIVLLLVITLIVINSSAQNYSWANSIGSLGTDYAQSVTTDVNGNVYITGNFYGTADFDPSANTANLTSGGKDIFIAKYDNNGNYLWAKAMISHGTYTNAIGRSIITDASGNVYITGYFQDTTDFDPGPSTVTLTTQSPGNNAIYVAKYDANGNYLWVKTVEGARGDSKSIAIDGNGNLYITGLFSGTGDFDPSPAVANFTAYAFNSVFIAKYDANGNYLWVKGIGSTTSSLDGGMSVATDINNNVYVTGFFSATAADISTNTPILFSAGGNDIFIVKYNSNGTRLWAKSVGSSQNYDYGVSITTDINSNVYVTGRFSGTADFDPSSNSANLSSAGGPFGGTDIFIAKYTTNGAYVWAHALGLSGFNDTGFSVKTDNNGDYVYIMGYVGGAADFDPSVNTATINSTGGNFLAKYDVNGNYIWAENIGNGTTGDDANRLMTVDGLGNVYVTSYFQGTVDFDPGVNTANLTSVGNNDIFIVKYSPCYTVNNPQQVCGSYSIGNSTYTATGTYTNILQSVSQCDSVVITQLTVTPLPTFTLSSTTGAITCVNSTVGCTLTTMSSFIWSGPGVISPSTTSSSINVYTPGIYTVALVSGLCQNTGTFAVTSNTTTPSFTMAYNTASVCAGSSVSISANPTTTNSASYFWSNGASTQSIIVSPALTTVYTVTVTDNASGCYASGSTTVDIYAQHTLTITGNNSVCLGSSSTLTVVNGGIVYFLWSNGSTQPITSVIPSVSSIYTVNTIDINGCSNSGTMSITVDPNCTDVWPGDANSDGVADNLDVLELGLHYTQTDAPRATISNSWQPYFANNWVGTITNGKNLNHSDCNGDGTINDNDTLAIYNNYGLTHTFKPVQANTVNAQLSIVPDQPGVVKGAWGTASIYLGDATTNINAINGVAFIVDFDNTLIETNNIWIEYLPSFIDASQNLHFRKLDFTNGKIFTATTHTVSNNVSGYGKIATLRYQIKSSLTTDQVLNLGISQGNKSDVSGLITPLTSGTGTLLAMGASVSLQELNGSIISISPNPTNGSLTINSKTELQKIEIVSITGQVLLSETPTNVSHTLHLENFGNGIYFVSVYQNDRVVKREKIILNK